MDWNRKYTDQSNVVLHVDLPGHFPKKYDKSIGKTVDNCTIARIAKDLSSNSFQHKITRL